MANSTKSARKDKPNKPYPEFPLFPHATNRWAKKIRGKTHYFGPWNDPDAALQKYLEQKDDLHAGKTPRPHSDGLTVRELCNRFLTGKQRLMDSNEIGPRMFARYRDVCAKVIAALGRQRSVTDLAADDFDRFRAQLAKGRGPVTLGNDVRDVRSIFKYAYDAGLVDRPVRFGPNFKQPSKSVLRKQRAKNGPCMFEAVELRRIIDALNGDPIMRSMVLLGINCGFGNTDCANLPQSVVDLEGGWIDYPRPKTGIGRRCPMWPETVDALRSAIALRAKPKESADDDLCFVTIQGNRWVRVKPGIDNPARYSKVDAVGRRFSALLTKLGINGRHRLGFYALRHVFETIAGESTDQVAVNAVMGHVDSSMAAHYRERISDERLQAVVETVRKWLWPDDVPVAP
jgi:integrase